MTRKFVSCWRITWGDTVTRADRRRGECALPTACRTHAGFTDRRCDDAGDDGFTICRELRKTNDTPIIMLTASADDTDRILGLELGADDYIGKPFNPRELLA